MSIPPVRFSSLNSQQWGQIPQFNKDTILASEDFDIAGLINSYGDAFEPEETSGPGEASGNAELDDFDLKITVDPDGGALSQSSSPSQLHSDLDIAELIGSYGDAFEPEETGGSDEASGNAELDDFDLKITVDPNESALSIPEGIEGSDSNSTPSLDALSQSSSASQLNINAPIFMPSAMSSAGQAATVEEMRKELKNLESQIIIASRALKTKLRDRREIEGSKEDESILQTRRIKIEESIAHLTAHESDLNSKINMLKMRIELCSSATLNQ